jgi:anaerobic magnesium-protoporphyrin IX monomethyl ester cyclase
MRVLLLSMPDSFEHMPTVAIRMPNGALAALAGNIDSHHRIAIADLVLVQSRVRETVERLVHELQPDLVGVSVMTFQRATALKIARLVKCLRPSARIVAGGYDPSLAPHAYEASPDIDFVVRGEGERVLSTLLRALEAGGSASSVRGLSYRAQGGAFVHNETAPALRLASEPLRLPNRRARVLSGYTMLGRTVDVVETSRGCTFDCSFCSIIEMRGRNFHPYPIDRVLADIADARAHGAQTIFLVDDNITLDVQRFEALCRAIVDADLHRTDYIVQAMTAPLAEHGARIAPLMRKAGFRYVFLGIENILEDDLRFLKASAKNAKRDRGRRLGNASIDAIDHLHRNGMFVVGGLIVGNPDDTAESIEANLAFARRYVDWPYIQHPTPYPGTPMTRDFESRGLIVEDDVSRYDGTTAVVRTEHVSADDVELMRWRAERWMKVKHFPSALAHSPGFVLRNGRRMLAHTFAGTSWRSALGLESDRAVFQRFREHRRRERAYITLTPEESQAVRSAEASRYRAS